MTGSVGQRLVGNPPGGSGGYGCLVVPVIFSGIVGMAEHAEGRLSRMGSWRWGGFGGGMEDPLLAWGCGWLRGVCRMLW